MIEKYEKYLELIGYGLIQKHFEEQKDYIKCKQGCSFCCESGQYPFSEVEFEYLMLGYNTLSDEEKAIIQSKVQEVKSLKSEIIETEDKRFMYECPFLINKKCSVYKYRGIICRTHGLLFFMVDKDGKSSNKMPDCATKGLNYSNVLDLKTGILSVELWEKTGIKTEPVAYNLSQKAMLKNVLTEELQLEFGQTKALIEWL